jgi:hypothetical protein
MAHPFPDAAGSLADMVGNWSPDAEEESFRLASLRWFLRFYQRIKPEVLRELETRVPQSLRECLFSGEEPKSDQTEALQGALESWIQEFGLPNTKRMKAEAILTLLHAPLARPKRRFWWWDTVGDVQRELKAESSYRRTYSFSFSFEAQGWTPADESIEAAQRRLRNEFANTLSEQAERWRRREKIAIDLFTLWRRHRGHVRNIRWLAHKQACPGLSQGMIARRWRLRPETVRRGLHSAAECIGLPCERIRQAQPGRKS